MMKATYAIAALGASALAVPTFAPQSGEETLQMALQRTAHALEQLADMEQRFALAPTATLPEVVSATEPPLPAGPERDEKLNTLRTDLAKLQTDLDLAESRLPNPPPGRHAEKYAESRPTQNGVATTGLDTETLSRLMDVRPTVKREPASTKTSARPSLEPEGFSADVVGEGRALVRAGRYEEALERLGQAESDELVATYWTGRALEKLGRHDEAIAAYEQVILMDPEAFEGKRAKEDIEFLEWKRSFEKKSKAAQKKSPPAEQPSTTSGGSR